MGIKETVGLVIDAIADAVTDRIGSEALVKAGPTNMVLAPEAPVDDPKAIYWDPFALLETLGYRERYSMVSYDALQRMAYRMPIFPPILQIRLKQIQLFSRPQHDDNESGYQIRMRDKDAVPSKKERSQCRDLEEWVSTCGSTQGYIKDSFSTFLQKFAKDSLLYDQACHEIVYNRKGIPADFYAVDGSSIRIVDQPWNKDISKADKEIRYVQVYDGSVVQEFTPRDLCFAVRNPRTDLRANGYGISELELGIRIVTSSIYGFDYNSAFFKQGSVAKGMLNLPRVPDNKLRIFANQWHMVVSGIANAWRTPITNFEEASWIDFHTNNRDMEFGEWSNFLIKLFCGLCLIDPTEINFLYGNTGQTQSMGNQSNTETRVKHSRDKGLRPLLMFIEDNINRYLIWPINPELQFIFTGLDPKEAAAEIDNQKKQTTYLMTVDEMRELNDLEPLPDGLGECILDATWNQFQQMKTQMTQQQQQGGPEQQGDAREGQQGQEGGQEGGNGAQQEQAGGYPQQPEYPGEGGEQEQGQAEPEQKSFVFHKSLDGDIVEYEIK